MRLLNLRHTGIGANMILMRVMVRTVVSLNMMMMLMSKMMMVVILDGWNVTLNLYVEG